MDLNLNAFIGITYLVPIAITLRKVYAPSFDMPDTFLATLAKLETGRVPHGYPRRRDARRGHSLHA